MNVNQTGKKGIQVISLLLVGILLCLSVWSEPVPVLAKETLPGVETIMANNSQHNPYVILEVVPDKTQGSFGYLVEGEEPAASNSKSIKDMPVREEREKLLPTLGKQQLLASDSFGKENTKIAQIDRYKECFSVSGNTVSGNTVSMNKVEIRGRFIPDATGEYWGKTVDSQYELYDANNPKHEKLQQYRRYIDFEVGEKGEYAFGIQNVAKAANPASPTDRHVSLTESSTSGTQTATAYSNAYKFDLDLKDHLITTVDLDSLPAGTLLLKEIESTSTTGGQYEYYGQICSTAVGRGGIRQPIDTVSGNQIQGSVSDNSVSDNKVDDNEIQDSVSDNTVKPTEPSTAVPTEPSTETPTEPSTVASTESATAKPTESESKSESASHPSKGESVGDSQEPSGADLIFQPYAANTEDTTTPPEESMSVETPSEESTSAESTTPSKDSVSDNALPLAPVIRAGAGADFQYIHTKDGKNIVFNPKKVDQSVDTDHDGTPDVGSDGKTEAKTVLNTLTDTELSLYVTAALTRNDASGTYYIYQAAQTERLYGTGLAKTQWYKPLAEKESGTNYTGLATDHFVKLSDGREEYYYKATYQGATTDLKSMRWESDYTASVYESVFYENGEVGGITNHEWLKQYALDRDSRDYSKVVIDCRTITLSELSSYDLSKVGMLYFAGGSYPEDIAKDQALRIIREVMKKKLPVIWNRSAKVSTEENTANLSKLAIILRQDSFAELNQETKLTELKDNWDGSITGSTYWQTKQANRKKEFTSDATGKNGYVNQSVLLYDDSKIPFVSTEFPNQLSTEKIDYGFKAIAEEITHENFFRKVAGKPLLDTRISMATAVRYIMNYASQRNIIKEEIKVLEIEPCYSFSEYYSENDLKTIGTQKGTVTFHKINHNLLTPDRIARDWATQFKDAPEKIHLEQTYTGEFIGQIEDLNENYDLIYMGLDTTTMNTTSNKNEKTENTVYNDTSMNGLVYSHVGDRVSIPSYNQYDPMYQQKKALHGLLLPNNPSGESGNSEYDKYRYSGNDITPDKARDLKEFMDAGYPIIFADGFYRWTDKAKFETYQVNEAKIDRASNMYQVAQYAIEKQYLGKNVNIDSVIKESTEWGAKSVLASYLNLSKLNVTASMLPTPYEETAGNKYLTPENGEYYLNYEVALRNDASVSIVDTKYHAQLYIDTNVDGRFSTEEEITGLNISESKDGSFAPISSNADGKFELVAGKNYRISRQVPTGYVGVLPWKIIFVQNDNPLIRKAINGYSAIPISSVERQTIHVLQITSGAGRTELDLKSPNVTAVFNQLKDFNIVMDQISAENYIKTDNPIDGTQIGAYSTYLNQYDMLIIGFVDMFEFGGRKTNEKQTEAAAKAIRQYISDGRSVLFTHDTTSFNNSTESTEWGRIFNRYVRDVVGMDRYGILSEIKGQEVVDTKYDKANVAKSDPASNQVYATRQGYNDYTLTRYGTNDNAYLHSTRPGVWDRLEGHYHNTYVSAVNQGQITKYPFEIPDTFKVADTHAQYYQLNLETDSEDEIRDDDIVVWYCISNATHNNNGNKLGDDLYRATPNNVRNNYYIYNKGNVTYSGVGHSAVNTNGDITELKLFVNTMVAAYNAGIHPPKVTYKENAELTAAQIDYMYLPFDVAIGDKGAFLDDTAILYYDVTDTSFVQGSKVLGANYYMQVAEGTPGAVKTFVNGSEIYLKQLTLGNGEIKEVFDLKQQVPLTNIYEISNNTRYRLTLDTEKLALRGEDSVNIYVGSKITYTLNGKQSSTDESYAKLGIVKTQLLDLK